MSNLAVFPYPHVYRDPHPDCVPGCGYPYWASDVHPVHCKKWSSRGLICHTIRDGQSHEVEVSVAVASATRDSHGDVNYSAALERHRNIVRLRGAGMDVDFSRGEARSLAAVLIHAADVADGLIR